MEGVVMRETFGIRLKKIRKQKGMTQKELAEKSGLPQSQICRYEKDILSPTLNTFEWICDALEVSATELLGF